MWDNHTANSLDDRVGYTSAGVPDPVEQQHYNAFANDPLLTGTGVPEPVDETPPDVIVSSPADGSTVAGTVPVTGTATDDVEVDSVTCSSTGPRSPPTSPDADGAVSFDWNSATVPTACTRSSCARETRRATRRCPTRSSVTVENVDAEPPTPPPGLTATWSTPSQVALGWAAASDNGAVTGYRVYRDSRIDRDAGSGGALPRGPGDRQPDHPQLRRLGPRRGGNESAERAGRRGDRRRHSAQHRRRSPPSSPPLTRPR